MKKNIINYSMLIINYYNKNHIRSLLQKEVDYKSHAIIIINLK